MHIMEILVWILGTEGPPRLVHSHNLLILAARSSRSLASSFFESSILCGLIRCFADVPAHPSTTHAYSSARQKYRSSQAHDRKQATRAGRSHRYSSAHD